MKPRYETKDELTAREWDVAQLVAQGLSNGQIADALSITVKAVERHMTSILSKLGLERRTQLVIYLVRPAQVTIGNIQSV